MLGGGGEGVKSRKNYTYWKNEDNGLDTETYQYVPDIFICSFKRTKSNANTCERLEKDVNVLLTIL